MDVYHERIRQDTGGFRNFTRPGQDAEAITVGQRYLFVYPDFKGNNPTESHPDYTAHRFHEVTVERECIDGFVDPVNGEYDREPGEDDAGNEVPGERMLRVRADDGWTGDVWESELFPLTLAEYEAEQAATT